MSPKLEKINLNKRDKCTHPNINTRSSYLAKINGSWYAGKFSKQWYGLNFEAVYDAGIQLNDEDWEELYEIVGRNKR